MLLIITLKTLIETVLVLVLYVEIVFFPWLFKVLADERHPLNVSVRNFTSDFFINFYSS